MSSFALVDAGAEVNDLSVLPACPYRRHCLRRREQRSIVHPETGLGTLKQLLLRQREEGVKVGLEPLIITDAILGLIYIQARPELWKRGEGYELDS